MKNLLFLFSFLTLVSCTGQPAAVTKVSVQEASGKMKGMQVIDVRTPGEFAQGNIAGSRNIDWYDPVFNQQVEKLDKQKPVLVYCKVGGRSAEAAARLAELGFKEIYDLDGGYMKWSAIKTPTTKWTGMTMDDFEKLKKSQPDLLVNFYAEWCAPCRKMAPYMNPLIDQSNGKAVRIDVDKNKSLFKALNLEELPVILIYKDGKETFRHGGYLSEANLKAQWP
ncbi:MAG TPA: thioredoxin domain-containing protein [Flavobacterium sp.]|nr:thioredoxin domain-containing protein [Flavobacterium sp.]